MELFQTLSWLRLAKSPFLRSVVEKMIRRSHLLKLHAFSLATGRKATGVDHGSSVRAELNCYIQVSSGEEEVDCLDFWKMHAKVFPRLYIVAMRVLAVPASSAPEGI